MTEPININGQEKENASEITQPVINVFEEPPQKVKNPCIVKGDTVQPPRRVGTITMGICLILCGICLCAYLIHPSENIVELLKFAPLILVGLGVEILWANVTCKSRKIKYDILSIFISMILISMSICASAVVYWADYYSPQSYNQQLKLKDELYSICYEQLKNDPIDNLSIDFDNSYPYIYFPYVSQNITIDDVKGSSELTINITLKGEYASRQEFASTAKDIIEKLNAIGVKPQTMRFWGVKEDCSYELWVNGWFSQDLTETELTEQVIAYDENGEQVEEEPAS